MRTNLLFLLAGVIIGIAGFFCASVAVCEYAERFSYPDSESDHD